MPENINSDLVLVSPKSGECVPLLRKDWKRLVGKRKQFYGKNVNLKNLHHPLPVHFEWCGGVKPYTLTVCGGGKNYEIKNLQSCNYDFFNLFTGTQYQWTVKCAAGGCAAGVFRTEQTMRLIELPVHYGGPVNIRDIGGCASVFGSRVKQGIIYRGSQNIWDDGFVNIFDQNGIARNDKAVDVPGFAAANGEFMRNELGIRTELDFRYACQIEEGNVTGSFLGEDVNWIHIPIDAYNSFTGEQSVLFKKVFRLFADEKNYPFYFHCYGGVDRTGEVAFLLNALAGVAEEDLFNDYEASSLSLFPRPRTIPYFQQFIEKIASYSPNGTPLAEQVWNYMSAIGVAEYEIAAVRKNMLE